MDISVFYSFDIWSFVYYGVYILDIRL